MKKVLATGLLVIMASFSIPAAVTDVHAPFDQVLRTHVRDGYVDYPAIRSNPLFQNYLDYLASAQPESFTTREERLAFWINAYNALTIKGILDGLSPSNFFSRIRFFKTDYRLAGRDIDLYDLEHDIIIPFGEPRIHFAIVCASSSCPALISEAYTADRLDSQLDGNTRLFINNSAKNKFDTVHKTARISKIFDWFAEDFETETRTVQQFIGSYIEDPETAAALLDNQYQLWFLDYDWSLNGRQPG